MPCEVKRFADGSSMIVCIRPRKPKCIVCGMYAGFLCDFDIGEGKTCDNPVCAQHRVRIALNVDHCPEHKEWTSRF